MLSFVMTMSPEEGSPLPPRLDSKCACMHSDLGSLEMRDPTTPSPVREPLRHIHTSGEALLQKQEVSAYR